MLGFRWVVSFSVALLFVVFLSPTGTMAQVGGGASTNAVAGPDCDENCGEVSDPYNPGASGMGCWVTGVGRGWGVGCWYTATSCGFQHECSPFYQADALSGEGVFVPRCTVGEARPMPAEAIAFGVRLQRAADARIDMRRVPDARLYTLEM